MLSHFDPGPLISSQDAKNRRGEWLEIRTPKQTYAYGRTAPSEWRWEGHLILLRWKPKHTHTRTGSFRCWSACACCAFKSACIRHRIRVTVCVLGALKPVCGCRYVWSRFSHDTLCMCVCVGLLHALVIFSTAFMRQYRSIRVHQSGGDPWARNGVDISSSQCSQLREIP